MAELEGAWKRWEPELADPLSVIPPLRKRAPRLRGMEGRRVALFYNHKPKGARLLEIIGELLETAYGAHVVKSEFTKALDRPAEPSLVAAVARDVDLVIVGVGDSGSPSLLTVHDALEVERNGVPAVAVCTEPFGPGDAAMAAMRGAPHLGIAVVPHPVVTLDEAGLRSRAQVAVPRIVSLATAETPEPEK